MYVQPYVSFGRAIAFVGVASFTLGVIVGAVGLWLVLATGVTSPLKTSELVQPTRFQLALPKAEPQSTSPLTKPGEPLRMPAWLAAERQPEDLGIASAFGPEEPLAAVAGGFRLGGGDRWSAAMTFEVEPPVLSLPPARMAVLQELPADAVVAQTVEVRRGDTLLSILLSAGVSTAEAHEAVSSLAEVYDPRQLRPGQFLTLELERSRRSEGTLRLAGLSFAVDPRKELALSRDPDGSFVARTVERELSAMPRIASGTIDDSLYAAAMRQQVPAATLAEAIRLLSWDVDFQRDIQPGDRFELLYQELVTADGEAAVEGDLLYVALELQGRRVEAFRFEEDGRVNWYDREGRSLRKSLLKTPIDGARLSSRFGNRRHPILGYTRMHKGVDFAAPTGTPIYAAGDGVVVLAGWNGSYGNYVRIRHNREYQTAYAHMSRIAEGVRAGVRVRQGQVIGYVGSTGRSTGPHLHYEVLRAGRQVNPLQVAGTIEQRLEGEALKQFRRQVAEVDALRQRLVAEKLVANRGAL
jgi:murein DD-endopeptidase MepM/ murein hydrolase activator NlpD